MDRALASQVTVTAGVLCAITLLSFLFDFNPVGDLGHAGSCAGFVL
jgi:hypothetical protein